MSKDHDHFMSRDLLTKTSVMNMWMAFFKPHVSLTFVHCQQISVCGAYTFEYKLVSVYAVTKQQVSPYGNCSVAWQQGSYQLFNSLLPDNKPPIG